MHGHDPGQLLDRDDDGQAKAEAYRAGVESLGAQGYTTMQLMQIVGDRNVRIVPDVAVSGASANVG